MAQVYTVKALSGVVFVVSATGQARALKVGDEVAVGETVVSGTGGRVELVSQDASPVVLEGQAELKLDDSVFATSAPKAAAAAVGSATIAQVIDTLANAGDLTEELEAPAAGAGGGAGNDGSGFVRLLRIVEPVDPLAFAFETALSPIPPSIEPLGGLATEAVEPPSPVPPPPPIAPPPPVVSPPPPPVVSPPVVSPPPPPPSEPPSPPPPPSEPPPPPPPPAAVVSRDEVDEAGMPQGTDPDSDREIATGTLVLPAGWTAVPTTGSTPYGTYTINADGSYTYTLTVRTTDVAGEEETDIVTYQMTDGQGRLVTNTLVITIVDDVPVAKDDGVQTVTEDVPVQSVSGDVLANDVYGADGQHASTAFAWGDNTAAAEVLAQYGTLTLGTDGSYRFVLNNASAAVQALTAQDTVEQALTYTIRDADGDTSTAQVTIQIRGSDETQGVVAPPVVVQERGLTSPSDTSETVTGAISLTSSSGIVAVQIGGQTFTVAQLATLATLPESERTVDTGKGLLTLTDFVSADGNLTGTLNYSYTLSAALQHSGGADVLDQVPVVLQTLAGSPDSTATLNVSIVDDVPEARGDSDQVTAGSNDSLLGRSTNGNVIDGLGTTSSSTGVDQPGADGDVRVTAINGVPVFGPTTIAGTYGTLVLNASGFYTYQVTNPAAANGLSDVFSYTITDSDGSSSSADLTIFLGKDSLVPQVLGAVGEVSESGLPQGTAPLSDAETTSGSFMVKDNGQGFALTVAGVTVNLGSGLPQTITGALGTLTITGYTQAGTGTGSEYAVNYTYQLITPTANNTGTVNDVFNVSVVDGTGDASNVGQVVIAVRDDAPVARNDFDSTAADYGQKATGNVITGAGTVGGVGGAGADSLSADGTTVTGVLRADTGTTGAVGTALQGKYGTLTLLADGTYTYTVTANHNGAAVGYTEIFDYTLTDSDGSISTARLSIAITETVVFPSVTVTDGQVFESDINERGIGPSAVAGSNPGGTGEFLFGEFTVEGSGENAWRSITINGQNVATGAVIYTTNGTLYITSWPTSGAVRTATYLYELRNPADHTAGPVSDSFTVSATDYSGDTTTKTFAINIVDDAPVAHVDEENTLGYRLLLSSGNVISGQGTLSPESARDSAGADGALVIVEGSAEGGTTTSASGGVLVLAGQYGTLTLQTDGRYTYQVAANVYGTAVVDDVFVYTVQDADGSLSTSELIVHVQPVGLGPGPDPVIVLNPIAVHEAGIEPSGSNAGNTAASVSSNFILDGFGSGTPTLTIAGQAVDLDSLGSGVTVTTPNGTLTVTGWNPATGEVTYTYQLTTPASHAGSALDNVAIVATSATDPAVGASNTLPVTIIDDVPLARDETDAVMVGAVDQPATGNVLTGVDTAGGDANTMDGVADTAGADGGLRVVAVGGSPVVSGGTTVIAGSYGTLTLASDGSYSYVPNSGNIAGQQDEFTYTVADADGSTSSATLTVNLLPNTLAPIVTSPVGPGPNGAWVLLESDVATGSNAAGNGETLTGLTVSIDTQGVPLASVRNPYTGQTHTVASLMDASTTPVISSNANYKVTITGFVVSGDTVTFTYDVERLTRVANSNDQDLAINLNWRATNTNGVLSGNTASSQIRHLVEDDAHTAVADTVSTTEAAGGVVTGSLIGNDIKGADGGITVAGAAVGPAPATPVVGGVGLVLSGSYGTLVVQANGSYTYTNVSQSVPVGAQDVFSYTLIDSDGSLSNAIVTIDIAQDTRIPTLDTTSPAPVHEAGLSLADVLSGDAIGSMPGDVAAPVRTSGSVSIDGQGELVSLSIDGAPVALNTSSVGAVFEGFHGLLTITAISTVAGVTTVSYTYDLTNNRLGAGGDDFSFSVTDATGDNVVKMLHIDIVDDAPVAGNDTDAGVAAAGTLISGNVITGDGTAEGLGGIGTDRLGADDAAVAGVSAGLTPPAPWGASSYTVAGAFGVLTLYPDGSYTYEVGTASPGDVDVFTYVLRDADGSTATATLEIQLTAPAAGSVAPGSVTSIEPLDARDVLLTPESALVLEGVGATGTALLSGAPADIDLLAFAPTNPLIHTVNGNGTQDG